MVRSVRLLLNVILTNGMYGYLLHYKVNGIPDDGANCSSDLTVRKALAEMQSNRLLHQEMADLFQLIEEMEPRRCMFDLFGRCDAPSVNGHFIQEGLIKLLRNRDKEVKSFYNFAARNLSEMSVFHTMNEAISTKLAARRPFLCRKHEEFFADIENPRPNWDDPVHLLKIAYRSCLIEVYIKEWFIGVWSKIPVMKAHLEIQKRQLRFASSLAEAIRNDLRESGCNEIKHVIAYIHCRPMIAATGVIGHPNRGAFIFDELNNRIFPLQSSPFTISVLPERGRQIVLFSYKREGLLDARHLLDGLEYSNETISTGKLSKKIIEEMELIHISPDAWERLGEMKQERILAYWIDSRGLSEEEFTIPPNLVDLFVA